MFTKVKDLFANFVALFKSTEANVAHKAEVLAKEVFKNFKAKAKEFGGVAEAEAQEQLNKLLSEAAEKLQAEVKKRVEEQTKKELKKQLEDRLK